LGLLFSFIVALLAYRKAQEPYKLKKIIDEKTEQLSKSERYFRTLIETSSDAIVLLDANGQVLYQSPSTDKILGYTLTEVQQMDNLQLIHPDDREEDNNIFYKEISEPGVIVQRSHRVKHKKGNYIYIEGTYRNLLHDENIKAIVYSYKDVTEKVLSEQILIESENRFRRAFEDSAIGMGLTSIQEYSMGRWLKVNRSLCDMLGYTEKDLLSLTFMQITHPDDLAKDLAAQDRILQGESDTYRLEKRYLHKDGSFVWINLNVSIVRDKDKKPIYLVAQIENITEKLESQTKFQNLVENFVVGVYILQDNKIVYVNPRVAEETGYTEDEIINMPFDRFIYPDDLKLINDNIDIKTKNDTKATRYDARIQGKDGQLIWYEILGSSTLYHGGTALIGTMINITERKAIYDELIRSEANLKSIFDTTDISYLLLDVNYNIIAFNQQMRNVYIDIAGFKLKEGDNLIELMLPEKRETAKAVYDRIVQTNRSEDYETSYGKEGAYRHFLANVKPIHDGNKAIGICISAMDITERKKMTLDLLSHVNAIEEQNKKLREIAWIQSHVVRAPLSRIMGLIDLFTNHETDDMDKNTILDYILISAKELDEIVKSISDKVYDNSDDPGQELH
jgi:PAS domain S-box-containing protein